MAPQPVPLAGLERTASSLPATSADGSIPSRVRLVFHEYYGQGSLWGCQILLMPLISLLIFLGLGYFSFRHQEPLGLQSMVGVVMIQTTLIWTSNWPKMDALYPFSRRERFGIVAIWSIAQELLLLVTVLFSAGGMAWGALLAGGNRQGDGLAAAAAALTVSLIGIPVIQLASLYRSRRQVLRARALWLSSWCVFVVGIGFWPMPAIAAFPLAYWALAAALGVVSHVIYFQGLRRTCLKADLVFQAA